MEQHHLAWITVGIAFALFVAVLICLEVGRRVGLRQNQKHGTASRAGVGIVDASVYGLFGLLIGFTFSGAAGRFDQRQDIVAQQVNALGTVWQRIDVLPPELQRPIRGAFENYLDTLIASYSDFPGLPNALREPAQLTRAQNVVWSQAVAAVLTKAGEPARMLLLPALNEAFGAVERERLARRIHPPLVIFVMLAFTALAASIVGGYGMATGPTRNWTYMIVTAMTISVAAYVVIELEFPRIGFVRVEQMDRALQEFRASLR
jgi:hypothetical protein